MMNKNQLLLYHPHQGDLTGAIVVGSGLSTVVITMAVRGGSTRGTLTSLITRLLAANQEILSAKNRTFSIVFLLPPFSIEVIIFVFYFSDGNASPVSAMHWLLHSVK